MSDIDVKTEFVLTRRGRMVLYAALFAFAIVLGWFAYDILEWVSYVAYEYTGITLPWYPSL